VFDDNLQNRDFGPDFNKFKVTYGNALEYIADTLFDTRTYTSTTTTQLAFFSGQQTDDLTNLALGNMLPDKQGFLVMSIRFYPKVQPRSVARAAADAVQPGATNDVQQLTATGRLSFNFLNKDYGTFPLWMLPAGGGVQSMIAAEGATADPGGAIDFANNGFPDARNMYVLEQPLFLPPMTKLGVVARWPSALTLKNGNTALVIVFDGLMVRPVQ
jgi:hypothetical protein